MEKLIKTKKNGSMEYQKNTLPKSKKIYSVKPNKAQSKQKVKILIVEDNMIVRFFLSEMLKKLGYFADFVEDGKAALSSYCADYHLILMDLDIPCLNGLEVTQIIRAIEKNHHFESVPIVAITSHFDEPEYKEKCLSVGMNGLSGKPTAEQLEALILKFSKNYITHQDLDTHSKAKGSPVARRANPFFLQ
jgi:CheY-like chemotaxis protein